MLASRTVKLVFGGSSWAGPYPEDATGRALTFVLCIHCGRSVGSCLM